MLGTLSPVSGNGDLDGTAVSGGCLWHLRHVQGHAHALAQPAYSSAWMRQHHPAAYLTGFLTEAPGLWPPATVSHEARRWGVSLRGVCINRSGMSYRAENTRTVRLSLSVVEGVSETAARQIVQERLAGGKYASVEDFYDRVDIQKDAPDTLAKAGAFDAIDAQKNRREAYYVLHIIAHARRPGTRGLLSPKTQSPELSVLLPDELLSLDLETKGISESGRHPLDAWRARLRDLGCVPLSGLRHGSQQWTAGLVVIKQRPPTAKGFAFFVLEDGSTRVQAIISPDLWEAHRVLLRDARALIVQGEATVQGRAVTLRVERLSELPLGSWASAAD